MSKIIVADDDVLVRADMRLKLMERGHEVVLACTGYELTDALRRHPDADVAIVDVLMPEQDGLAAMRMVSRTRPNLRLIAISGGGRIGSSAYLALAKEVGAVAAFSKPVDYVELFAAVEVR